MTQPSLYFIQPHVLERLKNGQFIARRKHNKYPLKDRRDMLSPLNVTRRAIAYEPEVFSNRKTDLIHAAEALNNPDTKILMVGGPCGRGKTAFVRGLVEMMGGRDDTSGKNLQLLWFDVSRHTDFDEVVRFLVEYLTDVCQTQQHASETLPSFTADNPMGFQPLTKPSPFSRSAALALLSEKPPVAESQSDPIETLIQLLNRMCSMPIVLVIDNMEHLVTPDSMMRSQELKSALSLLLSFANVKLIMAGQSLPTRDKDLGQAVWNLALPPLTTEQSLACIQHHLNAEPDTDGLQEPLRSFRGEPFLLQPFAWLYKQFPSTVFWQEQLNQHPPEIVLWQALEKQLSPSEKTAFAILAMLRHSMTLSGMETVLAACLPDLTGFSLKSTGSLTQSLLLKKNYPPQMVLAKLKHRQTSGKTGEDAIHAHFHVNALFQSPLTQILSISEAIRIHEALHAFYLQEKNQRFPDRVYMARTRHLAHEAQYHLSQAKKLKRHAGQIQTSGDTTVEQTTATAPSRLSESPRAMVISEESSSQTAPEHYLPIANAMPLVIPIQPIIHSAFHSIQTETPQGSSNDTPQTLPISPEQEPADPETASQMPSETDTVFDQTKALYEQGHHAFCHYQHNQAIEYLTQAVHRLESQNQTPSCRDMLANAYFDLAEIAAFRDNVAEAAVYYQKSLALKVDDPDFQAKLWFQWALALDSEKKDPNEAITAYQTCIAACQKAGEKQLLGSAMYNLATLYYETDQLQDAFSTLESGLQTDWENGIAEDLANSLLFMAKVQTNRGMLNEAEAYAGQAYQVTKRAGISPLAAEACLLLGHLTEETQAFQAAWNWYHEARDLGQESLSQESLARIQEYCKHIEKKLNEHAHKSLV